MPKAETIHLITRVVNWQNLPHVERSIRVALDGIPFKWWLTYEPPAKCCPESATLAPFPTVDRAPYGLDRYNHVLDLIEDGWVYGLDDDNALHPRFREVVKYMDRCDGMMFQQELRPLCPFPLDKKSRVVKSFLGTGAVTPGAAAGGRLSALQQSVRRELRGGLLSIGGYLSKRLAWMTERSKVPEVPLSCRIDLGQYLLKRSLIGSTRMRYEWSADGIFIGDIFQAHPDRILSIHEPIAFYNYLHTPRPWWWEKDAGQWCSELKDLVKRWVLLKLGRTTPEGKTA